MPFESGPRGPGQTKARRKAGLRVAHRVRPTVRRHRSWRLCMVETRVGRSGVMSEHCAAERSVARRDDVEQRLVVPDVLMTGCEQEAGEALARLELSVRDHRK